MSSQKTYKIRISDKLKPLKQDGIINDEILVDSRMTDNKKKDGKLLVFSNFSGCPGKNSAGNDLNVVYGKKSFQSINICKWFWLIFCICHEIGKI